MTINIPDKWLLYGSILFILSLNINVWFIFDIVGYKNEEIGAQSHVKKASEALHKRNELKREYGRLRTRDSLLTEMDSNITIPDTINTEDMTNEELIDLLNFINADTSITE